MSPEYAAEWVRKAEADRAAARRACEDSRTRAGQAGTVAEARKSLRTMGKAARAVVP